MMIDEHDVDHYIQRYYERELEALRHKARAQGITPSDQVEWARWLDRPSGEVGLPTLLPADPLDRHNATVIRFPLSHAAALEERCRIYRRALLGQDPPLAVSAKHIPVIEIKSAPPGAVKASPTTGLLTGYLSIFGTTDLASDIVNRGAYAKTIVEAKNNGRAFLWPLLWSHNPDEPIGGITEAVEDERGLKIKAIVDGDIKRGREVLSGIRQGYIRGLSVGFIPVRHTQRGDVRVLSEIKLMEGSLCVFAAQPEAEVLSLEF